MAAEVSPCFQFYPRDFLADERVRLMSHTERGIYITLLCLCWTEQTLPADPQHLARLVHVKPATFTRLWSGVLSQCFALGPDGRLHQKRLDLEREKQARRRQRASDAANERWQSQSTAPPMRSHPISIANGMPRAGAGAANSKQQAANPDRGKEGAGEKPDGETALFQRAGRLVNELYPLWFERFRAGARLPVMHGPMEFERAVVLCRTWDDARLEKLARIVLTTDERWISGTDRGFRVFAEKASWADDRLRQVEQGRAS